MLSELFNDDDGMFMGTPKSKFFDIVFNANRNLVEEELEALIERMCALEVVLEEKGVDIETILQEAIFSKSQEVEAKKFDTYISSTGNILTQNE